MITITDQLRVGIIAWVTRLPGGVGGQCYEKRWVLYGNSGVMVAQGPVRQKLGQVRADWKRFCKYTGTPYVRI